MKRLAIITTHPIQYNAPFFKLLAAEENMDVKVFYTWGSSVLDNKFDPGFGKQVKWDIPLLEGYKYEFLENISDNPGSHHRGGIDNPAIISRIEDYSPSALLIFGWNFKSHLKCLRYFKGKLPVFFRGDSTLLNEKPGLKTIARRILLKWVYRHVDYVLYVGENNKQYFLKHGLQQAQLMHAPHAVDAVRFMEPDNEYTARAKEWKERLGIQSNEITMLFAGKLESVKNPLFLLTLAELLKKLPVKIIIVGNGPLEKELKQKAEYLNNVIFLDFQNQTLMPVVYRLGDIFVMCSVSETWGLAANEAMACGLAVMLSYKTGGAIDLVSEEINGIIFNNNEIEKCIDFIKDLLKNKQKLLNMKHASKILIQQFSYKHTVQAIKNIL